ncbi:L1 protein [Pudu puda papillomavirus 1]|uniref:Major capsid protein L1 n=1 Tax=Pudu puda papillomavirus 1 TaxID=1747360 RepID=A0A1I9KHZ9_9PAPI|nr:L1 protein [Pudu puda papillomavirus 1]ALP46956.1 L1 protein [Pudu puda papillomavirus 1]
MAYWVSSSNNFFIPPSPVSRIYSTDEFVERTDQFYHAGSDRLLTVGHPMYEIVNEELEVVVPKVSANQYRAFRIYLPDPNKFAFSDPQFYDPDRQRLVWGLRGLEIGRGGPLGIGVIGNPLTNRFEDVENQGRYLPTQGVDNRQNIGMDNKQTQTIIVGSKPATGEHWGKALACAEPEPKKGDCPPIELVNSTIEDGDMMDTGFGNMDFKALQENKSEVPLDISQSICKYPDYLKMSKDPYGDSLFFFARSEQMYVRHTFSRAGTVGDKVPDAFYIKGQGGQSQENIGTPQYWGVPSGSLVSSSSQLFNKPYWILQAQGHNNGICWENELFITIGDNTRGTNFSLSVATKEEESFTASNFNEYTRHVEEFDISLLLQVCKVTLTPEVITHLHQMNPNIFDLWNLGVNPPPTLALSDSYRYIKSLATKCPDSIPSKEKKDPYENLKFWEVDLREKLSMDLDQFSLGRKFLYQRGTTPRSSTASRKRASQVTRSAKSTVKRRRKNA